LKPWAILDRIDGCISFLFPNLPQSVAGKPGGAGLMTGKIKQAPGIET
jgi:hypothetical protein